MPPKNAKDELKPMQAYRRAQSYGVAPLYGAVGGFGIGALLAGKRGLKTGAALGAIGTVAARRALHHPIDKLEKSDHPKLAGALGVAPSLAIGAAGVGSILGYSPVMHAADKAGKSFKDFMKRPGKFKVTYDLVPTSARRVYSSSMKLLPHHLSATDQLEDIIQFGAKQPLRKLSDIIPKKMTKEEIEKAEERLRKKMKPGKLAPMDNMPGTGSAYLSAREELGGILRFESTPVLSKAEAKRRASEKGGKRSRAADATAAAILGSGAGAVAGYHSIDSEGKTRAFKPGKFDLFKGFRPGSESSDATDYGSTLGRGHHGDRHQGIGGEDWKDWGDKSSASSAFQKGNISPNEIKARKLLQKEFKVAKTKLKHGAVGASIGAAALAAPFLLKKPYEAGQGREAAGKKVGSKIGSSIGAGAGVFGALAASHNPNAMLAGVLAGSITGSVIGNRIGGGIGARTKRKESAKAKVQMSAREELSAILQFGIDPRSRDQLGQFAGDNGEGISPDAMALTYKSNPAVKGIGAGLAGGAVSGVGALGAQSAIKSLLKKVRGAK